MNNTKSRKDEVYSHIMEDIFSSNFKPNQILNEKQLMERYGFSKAPIREALLTLCNEGVLRSIPRYGYEVVRLDYDDIKDIMDYRFILESGFLHKICGTITSAQLQTLKDLDTLCNTTEEDIINHWKYNMDFHIYLISCSGNDYAKQELERTMNILWRAYAQFYWNKNRKVHLSTDMKMHERIIEGLQKNDVAICMEGLKADFAEFIQM